MYSLKNVVKTFKNALTLYCVAHYVCRLAWLRHCIVRLCLTGMDLLGGGGCTPLALARGGLFFMIKQKIYRNILEVTIARKMLPQPAFHHTRT